LVASERRDPIEKTEPEAGDFMIAGILGLSEEAGQ
jgi:hypothetical protein